MKSDTPLDYAVLQLSPKRSRCELLVSTHGNTEKLASGSVKPFVTHLKVVEEQVALAVQSIKLEVEKSKNAETWFTKGTLERFVRFVSTPEVLELVNTFDSEMSQLEAARKIYSQGGGDQHPGALGGAGAGITAAADATKKELLRAIDVRFVAVKQDLTTACARASAAGFNPDTVSDLHVFADRFGAHRLNEACSKFKSLFHRRPELISQWKPGVDDRAVRSSCESDMSIDDPTEDPSGSLFRSQNKQEQQLDTSQSHLNQSRLSTCQQPQSIATSFPAQHNVNGKNEAKEESQEVSEKEKKEEAQNDSPFSSAPAGPPARRLSVQDRINLFENKQKESSGGSGGKPIVGKSVELRRLSSDASAAPERAVLRRWSGASDMSIDLSGDKKDIESPLCTPSSASSLSQAKSNNIVLGGSEGKDQKGLSDSANSSKVETRSGSVRVGDGGLKDQAERQTQVRVSLGKEEDWGSKLNCNSKEQAVSQPQSRSSTPQRVSQDNLNFNSEERSSGFKDQVSSATQLRGFSDQIIGVKNQAGTQTQIGSFASKAVDVSSDSRFVNKMESELVGKSVNQSRPRGFPSHSRSLSGQFDFGSGSKLKEAFVSQLKRVEGDQLPPQPQVKSFVGELEGGEIDVKASYEQQLMDEDSGGQKMKFQKQVSSRREQIKKSHGRRDESSLAYENSNLDFTAKKVSVNQESFSTVSKPPVDQVQRVRQTKGNQELNDELKMKANELEKLFAEHKLRVPGDQSSSARRNKPADIQVEEGASSQYKKAAAEEIVSPQLPEKGLVIEPSSSSSNMENFNTPPPMKMAVNQDYGDTLRQNFSELGLSDDSRGKFYEKYMQKRDAKLREEWGSKRAEKEAKLKAMQDSLERSRAELKAKFSGSANRQDSVSSARLRAEKLRSFNLRSSIKREQSIDSILSEEDEDLSEIPGQKLYGQDRSFTESSTGDGASRTTQSKKVLPNRNVSSSTPRTAVSPAPRSSAKLSNSSSGRRKVQSENPLAQSVPNFSDFRKENTKPSSGVSKTVTRPQRNYARSKSTSEEIPMIKEEKPRRSQSVRKSVANPVEYKDMSPLAPLDQIEQSPYEKFPRSMESKPFLRKGNGIGPGSGASIAKLKASIAPEALRNEEFDELEFEAEDSMDMVQEDEEQEEVEPMEVEDCINLDNGKPRLSQESDKSDNSGSDNGDSLRSLSQADPASAAEEPATMPSAFHAVGSLLDSPGESPMSWNARIQYPFSYPHETSDIEASADSPIGSPASWNSHGLAQAEADAARMRKKWGSAQKPVVINSSHNQPRKDMTKGFKRLLKFGRKSRGTESLVDWISATTSEGDDDTEDGRDLTSRFSEDLRKSRMGFLPGDESYNESEYIEQDQSLQTSIPTPPGNFKPRDDPLSGSSLKAPRSFFFSSFRSKAGDSKLR